VLEPAATPVTTVVGPLVRLNDAIAVDDEFHKVPVGVPFKVTVPPTQIVKVPGPTEIIGSAFTVNVAVVLQPILLV